MGWVGRRRKESGASSCADSVERFAMRLEKDKSQERSVSGGSATSATSASSGMSAESELLETPLDVATTKAPPVGLGFDMPPKISDAVAAPALLVDGSEAHDGNLLPNNLVITDPADATGDRPGDRPLSPHMSHTQQRQISGAKPYASIRLASGTRAPSLRSMRQAQTLLSGADGTKGDEADDEMSHLSTARRVTLRPTAADIFSAKSEREEEMEKQLAALAGKVKELEEQLVSIQAKKVEEEQSEQPGAAGGGGEHVREAEEAATELETEEAEPKDKPVQARPGSPFDLLPEGILTRLGLIPEQDGLPTRMRELPAYLFFVGVGVGAVMVKVLFSRSR